MARGGAADSRGRRVSIPDQICPGTVGTDRLRRPDYLATAPLVLGRVASGLAAQGCGLEYWSSERGDCVNEHRWALGGCDVWRICGGELRFRCELDALEATPPRAERNCVSHHDAN